MRCQFLYRVVCPKLLQWRLQLCGCCYKPYFVRQRQAATADLVLCCAVQQVCQVCRVSQVAPAPLAPSVPQVSRTVWWQPQGKRLHDQRAADSCMGVLLCCVGSAGVLYCGNNAGTQTTLGPGSKPKIRTSQVAQLPQHLLPIGTHFCAKDAHGKRMQLADVA